MVSRPSKPFQKYTPKGVVMSTKLKAFWKLTIKAVIHGIITGLIVVLILRLTGR